MNSFEQLIGETPMWWTKSLLQPCYIYDYPYACQTYCIRLLSHKAIWISPDHTTKKQINHISISKKFTGSMEDLRTRSGAETASDRHLVSVKMKPKPKNALDNRRNSSTTKAVRPPYEILTNSTKSS